MRLDSDHYTLHTDLPAEEAREAMRKLERTRAAILVSMWPQALGQQMTKVDVYVLQSSFEFEGLYPRRVRAFFHRSDNEALIVLSGRPDTWDVLFSGTSPSTSSPLNHELAHYLSAYTLSRQPRWLSEGLAEYLETLRLSEDGQTAVIGGPHHVAIDNMRSYLDAVQRGFSRGWTMQRVLHWDRTLEAREQDKDVGANYSGSWLLVHWLVNERAQSFAEYLALLNQGVAPDEALTRALPELKTSRLDALLYEYVRNGRFKERTVSVPPVGTGFIEEVIDDAQVHAVRSKLAALGAALAHREPFISNRHKVARTELDEALRLNPTGLLALSAKLSGAPEDQRVAIARDAVKAHPTETEAWRMLGSALRHAPNAEEERVAAYREALRLDPRSASAARELAWMFVTQDRAEEALPLARWAVTLAPWSPNALDTLALALAGTGACEEALQTEQHALELIQEEGSPELEQTIQERITGLENGTLCAPTPPGT
ncbi:TPR domain protein [Myxococcus hansupus]|uniref:TPR domain protein n=1 Tax=Pseudomyxococcus hansupus TaxID=1297742 RepID=A0A0H4X1S7_9BACT|nr:TPR domain protein [Myxococcus hansupus]